MNKYSAIVENIRTALAEQAKPLTRGTLAIIRAMEMDEAEKGTVVWIPVTEAASVFADAEKALTILEEDGLLANDGKPVRKRLGDTFRGMAIGVYFDDLLEKMRSVERESGQVLILKKQMRDMERQLKAANEASVGAGALLNALDDIADYLRVDPKTLRALGSAAKMDKPKGKALGGTPTLALSDLHYDENVNPAEIDYLQPEGYSIEIAERRLDRVFNETQDLLCNHMSGLHFESLVVANLGDMISGDIHEELRQSNEVSTPQAVFMLAEKLSSGILQLAQHFPEVYVPCVVGNHGRTDKKPRAKGKPFENWDWVLYQLMARILRAAPNVTVDVSESSDFEYDIYGTRYRLSHGDQIRTQGGVGGIYPSLLKADYRKRHRSIMAGRRCYDYMVVGHFHQYRFLNEGLIVNGSLKGYDEYAYQNNFAYEPPIQALWVTHPEYGITMHMPIYAEPETKDERVNLPPISLVKFGG